MKYAVLLYIIFNMSALACDKKVDESNVVLFVDVNGSMHEIESAKKAACLRGESFKVVPSNAIELGKVRERRRLREKEYKKCKKTKKSCEKAEENFRKVYKDFIAKTEKVDVRKEMNQTLKELSSKGQKISSLAISGHNGGGNFSSDGYRLKIKKSSLEEILNLYPDVTKDTTSLLLLGCYTTVKSEVLDWRTILPNVKIIAGYEGKGPLTDRPAAYQFVEDVLKSEKSILDSSSKKKLKRELSKNIRNLYDVFSGLYLDIGCDKDGMGQYYFATRNSDERLSNFDLSKCNEIKKEGESYIDILDYFSGRKDIPKNTSLGRLREIYEFSRRNDYCFLNDKEMGGYEILLADPNRLMGMLFYENVKDNFSEFYKDIHETFDSAVENLTLDSIDQTFDLYMNKLRADFDNSTNFLSALETNASEVIRRQKEFVEEAEKYLEELRNNEQYTEVFAAYNDPERRSKLAPELITHIEEINRYIQSYKVSKNFVDKARGLSESEILEMTRKNRQKLFLKMSDLYNFKPDAKSLLAEGKKPWSLSKENLKGKTRAEILDNIHMMKRYKLFLRDSRLESYIDYGESILGRFNNLPDGWFERQNF